MNRSIMRSNLSLPDQCRPEGRLIPRRRVATKTNLLNGVGDFEMELSLAIQESLKYAQQKDISGRENGCSDHDIGNQEHVSTTRSQNELSKVSQSNQKISVQYSRSQPIFDASSMKGDVNEEVERLKDLLLSQAELIHCQHDEIIQKDKEIKSLKATKDALQCRLERMERRMSMLKHRDDSHDVHDRLIYPIKHAISPIPHQQTFTRTHIQKSPHEASNSSLWRRRKNFKWSQVKKHKRQHRSSLGHLEQLDSSGVNDKSRKQEFVTAEEVLEEDVTEDEEIQSEHSEMQERLDITKDKSDSEDESEDNAIDYPIMQTDVMYHLYYPKHACPASPDSKRLQDQIEVETPSWRLNPLTNMYQLEGTENITDEAYLKRHQKFEQEEKRRKRWDLQRIRELQALEKLEKQREDEIRASQDEADMETFLPSIHELKHIEITDCVPVMAFGRPVPYVSPAEFEVPWEMNGPLDQYSSAARQRNNSTSTSKRH